VFAIGFFLGLLFVTPLVMAYVLFVRWCDRFEPEPWWLVACAFLWGAIFATTVGGMTSGILDTVLCNHLGWSPEDADAQKLSATLLAPLCEEGAKGFGVMLIAALGLMGMREMRGPLDGAIYGGIVGLGFTLTEDILYVAKQFVEAGFGGFAFLLFLRTVLLGLSHCTFTACTGLGFGIATESRNGFVRFSAPLVGLVLAMLMHAMHNGLPSYFGEGGLVLMLLVSWAIDVAFFMLLAVLVVRMRNRLLKELSDEVGTLLHPAEVPMVASYVTLNMRNVGVFFSRGFKAYRKRRVKQLALFELGFLKSRRRRGDPDEDFDQEEERLRQQILAANRDGIFMG
jgi:protease PrsW